MQNGLKVLQCITNGTEMTQHDDNVRERKREEGREEGREREERERGDVVWGASKRKREGNSEESNGDNEDREGRLRLFYF